MARRIARRGANWVAIRDAGSQGGRAIRTLQETGKGLQRVPKLRDAVARSEMRAPMHHPTSESPCRTQPNSLVCRKTSLSSVIAALRACAPGASVGGLSAAVSLTPQGPTMPRPVRRKLADVIAAVQSKAVLPHFPLSGCWMPGDRPGPSGQTEVGALGAGGSQGARPQKADLPLDRWRPRWEC